jgi:hypothetical protein
MIIIEGMDNSGKSTLIRALRVVLPDWPVQASEGPPKYRGEQNDRVQRYMSQPVRTIYDRHPCVSQPIYSAMRSHQDPIDPALIARFYSCDPLFIYCDSGNRGMKDHVFNPATDTPEHIAEIRQNYYSLLEAYRQWAGQHAFLSYRIGDSMSRIVKTVEMLVSNGRA